MAKREKTLQALRKTFRRRSILLEAREGDRYWVSNGHWMAFIHRAELHLLLPQMPVSAINAISELRDGKGLTITEGGAQQDFGGMFPILETAYVQTKEVTVLNVLAYMGGEPIRILAVDDRTIYASSEYLTSIRELTEAEKITAEDEIGVIAFWKDGEVVGALMPEVDVRDAATRILAARWKPERNGEEGRPPATSAVMEAIDRLLEGVGEGNTMTMTGPGFDPVTVEGKAKKATNVTEPKPKKKK